MGKAKPKNIRVIKMKRKSKGAPSLTELIKRFIVCCVCILSVTGLAAGISVADSESRKMMLGEQQSTVALAHSEKTLKININEKTAATVNLSLPKKYEDILLFAPVPISSVVWLLSLFEQTAQSS